MNTINNSFAETTIVAFHIGRGGRFHNSGHKSFIGENKIGAYVGDLFVNYENTYEIGKEIGNRENLRHLYELVLDNMFGDDSFKESFEAKTGLKFGELVYTDGGGNQVGLTLAEEETGVGRININQDYDTTYTCKLSDCDNDELRLIYDTNQWVSSDVREYAAEALGLEEAQN